MPSISWKLLASLLACAAPAFASPTSHHDGSCNVTIPGIYTSNVTKFECSSTTRSHISQAKLQCAMDDFAYLFYTAKNVTAAFDKYVATNYVQHNPNIADGRAAVIAALDPLFSSPTTSFDIARVMVGPEYTVIHIKAITTGQPNFNVYDVYRTEGSCIVEHWDVMAAATVDNTTVSPHPYF